MTWYLDASAAVKLLGQEAEALALTAFLEDHAGVGPVRSSVVLETELRRMARREALDQELVSLHLEGVELILPEPDDFRAAGLLPVRTLRAIDALHLQTALRARVDGMIVYDRRLGDACHELGLRTVAPA